MPYFVVIKDGGPYPIGKYFAGSRDGGLKQAEWRVEEEGEKPRLLPKFQQIVIPFHVLEPYIKRLTNDNTGSLRRPEDR